MANNTTVQATIAKYPVTSMVRRCLHTLNLDNENIKLTANDQRDYILYGDSEQGIQGRALTEDEEAAYDHAIEMFERGKEKLERIGKGDLPLPEEKVYPALELNEPAYMFTATAFFYAPSWFLREMKRMLFYSLRLQAYPHGKHTTDIGILQFSVPNVTRLEAQKIAANYKDMIVSFYFPDERPASKKGGRTVVKQKSLAPVKGGNKPTIEVKPSEKAVTENKSQVTTRPASEKEKELARKIIEANKQQ